MGENGSRSVQPSEKKFSENVMLHYQELEGTFLIYSDAWNYTLSEGINE